MTWSKTFKFIKFPDSLNFSVIVKSSSEGSSVVENRKIYKYKNNDYYTNGHYK